MNLTKKLSFIIYIYEENAGQDDLPTRLGLVEIHNHEHSKEKEKSVSALWLRKKDIPKITRFELASGKSEKNLICIILDALIAE
jgi:hypothetical protein